MKTIIVILLLSMMLICLGQEKELLEVQDVYVETTQGWIRFDSTIQVIMVQYFLQLYDEYEQECYKDSTQTEHHITDGTPCYGTSRNWDDFTCITPGHYDEMTWVHKEPTFQGFMEFIRKKKGE